MQEPIQDLATAQNRSKFFVVRTSTINQLVCIIKVLITGRLLKRVMEESLKNLFGETMNLVKRYGHCLLKDSDVTIKEWEDLSSFMMFICDQNLKQDITFKRSKSFKLEIFPEAGDPEDVEDECAVFQLLRELQASFETVEFGRNNPPFKEFEDTILSKIPMKKPDNEVTAVAENVNLVDPITKLRLTDPVRNSICGHVYEKATILQLLNTKKIIKCPIPGCVAATKVMKKDLEPYTALKRFLEQSH